MTALRAPGGWRLCKVGDLCSLQNGRAFKPTDWGTNGLPIVRIQNLNNRKGAFNYFDGEVEPRHIIETGQLLFAWSGTPGTSFGAHIWSGGRAVLNQHIFKVHIDETTLDKRFFCFALNERLTSFIEQAHGGVGLRHITKGKFEETELAVPPVEVQRRIVAKLDALLAQSRAAREQLEAVPDLVETYRQSVLAAAFRGDLTADWRKKNPDVEPASKLLERIRLERRKAWEAAELAKMTAKGKPPKDDKWKSKYAEPAPVDTTGLPALPPTWCWASLELITVGDRTSGYGVLKPGPHIPNGVRLLKSGQVRDGSMDLTEDFRISRELSSQYSRTVLRGGEVLLNLVGASIGRSAVAPLTLAGANVSRAIAVLPIRSDLATWAQTWLMAPLSRRRMLADSGGSAQPVLNLELVRSLPVPLGPNAEAVTALRICEAQLSKVPNLLSTADLGSLETLERAVLANAFSGGLDLDRSGGKAEAGGGRRSHET